MKSKRAEKLQFRKDNLSAETLFNLGLWSLVGLNYCIVNVSLAMDYFQKAVERDANSEAAWYLKILNSVDNVHVTTYDYIVVAFRRTNDPRGWYIAGMGHINGQRFRWLKLSSDAGYSYAQVAFASYYNTNAYVELLTKSAQQNNPEALYELGNYYDMNALIIDSRRARPLILESATRGWLRSIRKYSYMLNHPIGGDRNVKEAIYWSAKAYDSHTLFLSKICEVGDDKNDLSLIYELGKGLYFEVCEKYVLIQTQEFQEKAQKCLDFYCDTIDSAQAAVFEFLLCWKFLNLNKDVGQLIAKLIWKISRF